MHTWDHNGHSDMDVHGHFDLHHYAYGYYDFFGGLPGVLHCERGRGIAPDIDGHFRLEQHHTRIEQRWSPDLHELLLRILVLHIVLRIVGNWFCTRLLGPLPVFLNDKLCVPRFDIRLVSVGRVRIFDRLLHLREQGLR